MAGSSPEPGVTFAPEGCRAPSPAEGPADKPGTDKASAEEYAEGTPTGAGGDNTGGGPSGGETSGGGTSGGGHPPVATPIRSGRGTGVSWSA